MIFLARKSLPPRPKLTVRVGVTGHRRLDRAVAEVLSSRVNEVLRAVATAQEAVRADNPDVFDGAPVLRVISPLATGADQVVARAGLALGWTLQSPLPFPREEYARDFAEGEERQAFEALLARSGAVFELDGRRGQETAAYTAVGRLVVEQSDVLIAVWDGEGERGAGGTAQIVREAREAGRLVVRIDSAAPHAVTLLDAPDTEPAASALIHRLTALLQVPAGDGLVRTYLREWRPWFTIGGLYCTFRDLVADAKWSAPLIRVPSFDGAPLTSADPVGVVVFRPLAWADGLANLCGGLHRTAFVLNYLLGAMAVLFALIGLVEGASWAAIAELCLIAVILTLTFVGRRRRWHQRWIGYRRLAERLRHLHFLAPCACASAPRAAARDGIEWLARAWERELGLVAARVDAGHLEAARVRLSGVVADQITYHTGNAGTLHRLNHRLHVAGDALFWLTGLLCLVHFGIHSEWLGAGAAVFPALGAAFYGIRSQGEFERVAERSRTVAYELEIILDALKRPSGSQADIAMLARRSAAIMGEELSDWHEVLRSKALTLPA